MRHLVKLLAALLVTASSGMAQGVGDPPRCQFRSESDFKPFGDTMKASLKIFEETVSCKAISEATGLWHYATGGGIVQERDKTYPFLGTQWYPYQTHPVDSGGSPNYTESWRCAAAVEQVLLNGDQPIDTQLACRINCCHFDEPWPPGAVPVHDVERGQFLVDLPERMGDGTAMPPVFVRIQGARMAASETDNLFHTGKQFCDLIGAGGRSEFQVAAYFSEVVGFFVVGADGRMGGWRLILDMLR